MEHGPPGHPEAARLAALRAVALLDTPDEPRFDRITALAARLLGVPISLIALVDRDRQWNKSRFGVPDREVPLADSICRYVVGGDAPLLVPDLSKDPRFADQASARAGLRFYAGWPLRDGTGVPLGTLCVLADAPRVLTLDEQDLMQSLAHWAQAELNTHALDGALREVRTAERRLLHLLDSAPAAVLLVTLAGDVEWSNSPAQQLFSAEGEPPLQGRALVALLPTLQLDELGAQGRRSTDRAGVPGRRFVHAGLRPDGTRFPAELTVSVAEGAGAARYVVFVRDLEQERTGEAQLAALLERTDAVFDALAEGVVGIQGDGTLSFGNLAAAQMLRRRRVDLPGADWHAVLHADRCPHQPCELTDPLALAGRTISGVELRRADGSSLPVELSVRMLRAGDGAAGVVVTLHDLTERLRVERLKNDLVAAVSHELRTPLTSIRGSLGLLRAGVVDPSSEQGTEMLDIATTSTERLSRLVDDILDLERLGAGKVELVIARHQAYRLMVSAAQAVSGAALSRGVTIDVVDGDVWVLADSDRTVQVLVNLIGNAVKFSDPASTVTLAARAEGDRVVLTVEDQGRGIPEDQLERIFERFAQVDGGDSREYGGSGLGLSIAHGLAEQHGGTLSARSTLGVGSIFALSLPAAPASASGPRD